MSQRSEGRNGIRGCGGSLLKFGMLTCSSMTMTRRPSSKMTTGPMRQEAEVDVAPLDVDDACIPCNVKVKFNNAIGDTLLFKDDKGRSFEAEVKDYEDGEDDVDDEDSEDGDDDEDGDDSHDDEDIHDDEDGNQEDEDSHDDEDIHDNDDDQEDEDSQDAYDDVPFNTPIFLKE
nr:nuclear polyadenylated RNA-binding protein 3-like [Aegilops tauschii subsp. strangulata]